MSRVVTELPFFAFFPTFVTFPYFIHKVSPTHCARLFRALGVCWSGRLAQGSDSRGSAAEYPALLSLLTRLLIAIYPLGCPKIGLIRAAAGHHHTGGLLEAPRPL